MKRIALSFISAVFNIILILFVAYLAVFEAWDWFLYFFYEYPYMFGVLILFLVFAAALNVLTVCYDTRSRKAPPTARVATTDNGNIYITLDTLMDIAAGAASRIDEVAAYKVTAHMEEQGLVFYITVRFKEGVNMPEASACIQRAAKSDVEAMCGINVCGVNIRVDNNLK